MYSTLVFLMTTLEMSAAIAGYLMQSQLIFYNVLIYGSPSYMLQNAFTSGSVLHQKNPIYWLFLFYHLLKYFFFFRANWLEEPNILRRLALLFEVIYIALSTYYLL